jgi:hypothetical protein
MSVKRNQDKIQQELKQIKGRRQLLQPKEVVAWAAKNKSSELYRCFEWDDGKAAEAYRIWQARELIKLVIVLEPNKPQYVSLSVDRTQNGGYRNLEEVEAAQPLRKVLVRDVLAEFVRLRERYADLGELKEIFLAIDHVNKR